jgi:hypothetical protein
MLFNKVPSGHASEPLIAATALFLVQTRGESHPQKDELQKQAVGMLGAAAQARNIAEDKRMDWFQSQGLNDVQRFLPALDRALQEMVGEGGWLFDRAAVTGTARRQPP